MELFPLHQICYEKTQEGEYVRRVRCSSNDKEYQDVKFWIQLYFR